METQGPRNMSHWSMSMEQVTVRARGERQAGGQAALDVASPILEAEAVNRIR